MKDPLLKPLRALQARIRGWRERPRRRRIPTQIIQLGVIFAAAAVGLIMLRQEFIPETFGDLGHYRAAAVDVNAAIEPHYAGWQMCAMCHPDKVQTKNKSFHKTVSCEACHGPASDHTTNPMQIHPEVPTGREPCLACHSYLASRPSGFPQVIEGRHNCSACHNTISRTKSVSAHAPLACEVCHDAPEEHKVKPRSHLPQKPFEREFCGGCHATDASPPEQLNGVDLSVYEIPRINLTTHGGTFVCWQCHYQHSPEAR
jgi:hypothetical protein